MFQILIVEDDKELSQLFQKVLEKNGYQVKSASDGAQALDVLVKEYIDLIISDIMMPVMGGYEATRQIRRLDRADGMYYFFLFSDYAKSTSWATWNVPEGYDFPGN